MSRRIDVESDGASRTAVVLSWISVVLLSAALIWNVGWTRYPFYAGYDYRLQAYLTANEPIVSGSKLRPDQLQAQLTWLTARQSDSIVGVAAHAAGRFARQKIDQYVPITREMLSETPPVDPTSAVSVIPVQVKGACASVLRPGQQLAFVKEGTFLPMDFTNVAGATANYLLRAIGPSDSPSTDSTLFIEVPVAQVGEIRSLVDGTWIPIVVPQKSASPPAP